MRTEILSRCRMLHRFQPVRFLPCVTSSPISAHVVSPALLWAPGPALPSQQAPTWPLKGQLPPSCCAHDQVLCGGVQDCEVSEATWPSVDRARTPFPPGKLVEGGLAAAAVRAVEPGWPVDWGSCLLSFGKFFSLPKGKRLRHHPKVIGHLFQC